MEVEKNIILLYITELLMKNGLISETEKNQMKNIINRSIEYVEGE